MILKELTDAIEPGTNISVRIIKSNTIEIKSKNQCYSYHKHPVAMIEVGHDKTINIYVFENAAKPIKMCSTELQVPLS